MKQNKALFVAVVILIIIVGLLTAITLERKEETEATRKAVNDLMTQFETYKLRIVTKESVRDPIEGKDYSIPEAIPGSDGNDGDDGNQGPQGPQGPKGNNGDSAYQVAVKNGYTGTEKQWLESLKAKPTPPTDIDFDCFAGLLGKKLASDELWQITNVKCEIGT